MRLIDADVLIDKYGDWYTEEGKEEGYIGTVKGIVDSIPTVPEWTGHWIPVGERLPETADTYLASRREIGWNCTEYFTVDICFFTGRSWNKISQEVNGIIAWMPMPEAYRKDGEAE